MEYTADFDICLQKAQVMEVIIRDLLFGRVKTDGAPETFEVKCDYGATTTGNLFIEYESRGKPSGLAVTKADWWVFEIPQYRDEAGDPGMVIFMRTDELKKQLRWLIRQDLAPKKLGGDNNSSLGRVPSIRHLVLKGKE